MGIVAFRYDRIEEALGLMSASYALAPTRRSISATLRGLPRAGPLDEALVAGRRAATMRPQ